MRIYTSKNCSYCEKLKNGLIELKLDFIEIDVDLDENKNEVEKVYKLAGEPVIPLIAMKPHLLAPKKSFNTIDEALTLIQTLIISNL
jgi:glutaredoxin